MVVTTHLPHLLLIRLRGARERTPPIRERAKWTAKKSQFTRLAREKALRKFPRSIPKRLHNYRCSELAYLEFWLPVPKLDEDITRLSIFVSSCKHTGKLFKS